MLLDPQTAAKTWTKAKWLITGTMIYTAPDDAWESNTCREWLVGTIQGDAVGAWRNCTKAAIDTTTDAAKRARTALEECKQ